MSDKKQEFGMLKVYKDTHKAFKRLALDEDKSIQEYMKDLAKKEKAKK